MYEVLLPVDRSVDRAAHQARYVSRLAEDDPDLEATVLYVYPPGRAGEAADGGFSAIDAAVEAATSLEDDGVTVERVAESGGVASKIVGAAADRDVDEVVVGGRKRSGVTSVLLGSTVQDVLLSAERPVTITGPNVVLGSGDRTVLVPVDGNEERARRQAGYVAGLPTPPETVVLHVFAHLDYAGAPDHSFDEVDAAVAAASVLEDAGVPVERVATGGEVARKILDVADDRDVDDIVVGGRKRSGVTALLLGSTAQDVLLSAERPVTVTG